MGKRGSGDGVVPPWGWWLVARDGFLVDERGRSWKSVRDAWWRGHLGFPTYLQEDQLLELILRTLTGFDCRWCVGQEHYHDLFPGYVTFWHFFSCWLVSVGLVEPTERADGGGSVIPSPYNAPLSDYGRSVMLMLQATRDPDWEALPMQDVVDAVARSGWGPSDQAREDALRAFEGAVGHRRWTFAREDVGRLHLVTLTGINAKARVPTRSVVWSLTFDEARSRDDLFGWLAQRVDRWSDWGDRAYHKGAAALTQHILALLVATLPLGDAAASSVRRD